MKVENLGLSGLKVFTPDIFKDSRGYFLETFNKEVYAKHGVDCEFVQDNQSYSKKGVLRGLHMQVGEFAQAKLVSVVCGEVLDIAVDLRVDSKTFGEHCSVLLSGDNIKQVYIPKGFAHGFVVLSDEAVFQYKCDNFYNQKSERSILYNDSDLNIDWVLKNSELIISDKDLESVTLKEFEASL